MTLIRTRADPEGIEQAARHVLADGLVVFPTETYYGLGCDPRRPAAVAGIFALKGRDSGQPLPLVAGGRGQVGLVAPGWERIPGVLRLADEYWPGPLAFVLPAAAELAEGVVAADGSIAVRWSSHPVAACLALAVGFPVVATSANRSGARPARTAGAATRLAAAADLFVLDGGPTRGGSPSTVVDLRSGQLTVVRRGVISARELTATLAGARGRRQC